MLFDTHCHLNFEAFEGRVKKVINDAKKVGVDQIVIPGTDIATSEKAVSIAEKYEGIYAAAGIHPHHVFEIFKAQVSVFSTKNLISSLSKLLSHSKVVAIGEVGIDRHIYQKTKHQDYKMNQEFVELQKIILKEQIKLAIKYDKSLILHNREAREDTLEILREMWDKKLERRIVFHCCEPDPVGTIHELSLLEFAKSHEMFIGVDGDITYYEDKQQFIKEIPLDMLVLETDSPFLSPTKQFPNEPKNIPLIAEFVAKLKGISVDEVAEITTGNAKKLFQL
ncbi:MAG TPA: TatD family hydrolase [Patescibacteria group bacterium]